VEVFVFNLLDKIHFYVRILYFDETTYVCLVSHRYVRMVSMERW